MNNTEHITKTVERTRAVAGEKYARRLVATLPIYIKEPVLFLKWHPMVGQHFWICDQPHDDAVVRLAVESEIFGFSVSVPQRLVARVYEQVCAIRRERLAVSDDAIMNRRWLKHFSDLGLYIVPDSDQIERNFQALFLVAGRPA